MEGLGRLVYARWLIVIINTRLLGMFSCPNTCKKTWTPLITNRVLRELKILSTYPIMSMAIKIIAVLLDQIVLSQGLVLFAASRRESKRIQQKNHNPDCVTSETSSYYS